MMYELLRTSPLFAQIDQYLDCLPSPQTPSRFSREEHRDMTLHSLFGQLELTAALAEKTGADLRLSVSGLLQMMGNFVGMVPCDGTEASQPEMAPFH